MVYRFAWVFHCVACMSRPGVVYLGMLSKKHYVAVAKIIAAQCPTSVEARQAIEQVANDLASYFQEDNPSFDSGRFEEACKKKVA